MLTAYQDSLFDQEPDDDLPPHLVELVHQADALAISTSGGKDSQALLNYVARLRDRHGWRGECFAIHADLGAIEWPGTQLAIKRQCQRVGIPLVVVRHRLEMIDIWRSRFAKLQAEGNTKPFWPSSRARFCTSSGKIDPINTYLRRYQRPVCFVGIRASESTGRAGKPLYAVRNGITTKALHYAGPGDRTSVERHAQLAAQQFPVETRKAKKGSLCRFALTVNPLIDWPTEQVWQECGTSTKDLTLRRNLFALEQYREAFDLFPCHWAYVAGNDRLSCCLCVLASENDIRNGAVLNPEIWQELFLLEKNSGWSFRHKKPLSAYRLEVSAYSETLKEIRSVLRSMKLIPSR